MEQKRSAILSSEVRSGNSTAAFNQNLQLLPQQISNNSRVSIFSFGNPINSEFIKPPLHNSYMSFGNKQSLQVSTQYNNAQYSTNYVQHIHKFSQSDLHSYKKIGQLKNIQHNGQSLRPISIIIANQDMNINNSNSTSSNQQKIQQNPYRYKKNINYQMHMANKNTNYDTKMNISNNINNNTTNTKVTQRANTTRTDNDIRATTVSTPNKAYNVTQIRNQQLNKEGKKECNCFCF